MSNTTIRRIGPGSRRLTLRRRANRNVLSRRRARQVFEQPVSYLSRLGLDVEIVSDDQDSLAPAA